MGFDGAIRRFEASLPGVEPHKAMLIFAIVTLLLLTHSAVAQGMDGNDDGTVHELVLYGTVSYAHSENEEGGYGDRASTYRSSTVAGGHLVLKGGRDEVKGVSPNGISMVFDHERRWGVDVPPEIRERMMARFSDAGASVQEALETVNTRSASGRTRGGVRIRFFPGSYTIHFWADDVPGTEEQQSSFEEGFVRERRGGGANITLRDNPLPPDGESISGSRTSEDGRARLSWDFSAAPAEEGVTILLSEDGAFRDITNESVDVIVGQRIWLMVSVFSDQVVVGGRWDVGGEEGGSIIDDWRVENNIPELLPFQSHADPVINFVCWDGTLSGQSQSISYRATLEDGSDLTADTTLIVHGPQSAVTAYLGTVAVRLVRHVDEGGEEQERLELGLLDTEVGVGARFSSGEVEMPAQFKEVPHELQYVQLVNYDAYITETDASAMQWQRSTTDGRFVHDDSYPYPSAREGGAQRTHDSPAVPMAGNPGAAQAVMNFHTYLMFRPGGEASTWVPLKRIEWGWRGYAMIKCKGIPDLGKPITDPNQFKLVRHDVVGPLIRNPSGYPAWNDISSGWTWKYMTPWVEYTVRRADEWTPPKWETEQGG